MRAEGPAALPWRLLDEARPSLQLLVGALERLPRDRLLAYARSYDDAMMQVCEPWNGPEVDGIQFSEDDTEDFTVWVVSQGRAYWKQAVASEDLTEFVRQYWAQRATSWDLAVENQAYEGFQSCRALATAIFELVHGGDLADELESPNQ